MLDKYNKKIQDYKKLDLYVIFYSDWCTYSINALELLRKHNLSYKGYKIDNITGNIDKLVNKLSDEAETTGFDTSHKTRPIIFYKGKFIGGYTELKEDVKKRLKAK